MDPGMSDCPVPWKAAAPVPSKGIDGLAMSNEARELLSTYLTLIDLAAVTGTRAKQIAIGASEIGWECDRRIAYRLCNTGASNHSDPMRLIVGTGVHLWLAERLRDLNGGSGRFLIEYDCVYRDIPGHGDLYDRFTRTAIDWKTTSKTRIKEMVRTGEPVMQYQVQIQHNAAALLDQGEDPARVALIFLARDGGLDDSWAWVTTPDRLTVDDAIDRIGRLEGTDPAQVRCTPGKDCGYCRYYNPKSTDLSWSCNAQKD